VWEYTVLTLDLWTESSEYGRQLAERDTLLAELGIAGWELVTVVPLVLDGMTEASGTTHERWVFKRAVNANGGRSSVAHATVEPEQAVSSDSPDTPSLLGMKEIPNPERNDDPS
jgi:hypothetical protein